MSLLAKRVSFYLSVLLGSHCFLSGQECGQLPAAFQYSDHFYQAQAKLYEANQGFSSGASIVYDELPINGHFNGSQGVKDYESLTIDQARSYIQQEHSEKAAQIIAECGYRLCTLAHSPSSMGATAISVLGEVCRQVSLSTETYSANKLQASPTLAAVIFGNAESLVREVSVANKVPGRVKVNVLVDPGSTNIDDLALDRSSFYLNTGESRKVRVAIHRPRTTDPVTAIIRFVNDADSAIFATSTFNLYRDPSLLLPAPKIGEGLLYPNAKMWLDIKGGPREAHEDAGPYTPPVAPRGPQKGNPNGGYNTEGHATYSATLNAPSPSPASVAATMSMTGEAGGRCGEGNTGGGGGFQPRWETSLTLPGLADLHSWEVQVTTDIRHYSEDKSAACNVSIGSDIKNVSINGKTTSNYHIASGVYPFVLYCTGTNPFVGCTGHAGRDDHYESVHYIVAIEANRTRSKSKAKVTHQTPGN